MRITNQANAQFTAVANQCDRSVEAGMGMVRAHRLSALLRLYPTPATGTGTATRDLDAKSKLKRESGNKCLTAGFAKEFGRLSWHAHQPSHVGICRQSTE